MSQKWEYFVEEMKTADAGGLAQVINKRAEDGWELVTVSSPHLYFKRARKPAR